MNLVLKKVKKKLIDMMKLMKNVRLKVHLLLIKFYCYICYELGLGENHINAVISS